MKFFIRNNNVNAIMKRDGKLNIILKGSTAMKELKSSFPKSFLRIRNEMIESGILKSQGENFVFTQDYECSSPSKAGSLVVGTSSNGLTMWKNKDGKTLKWILSRLEG
ncbi:DUF4357 domain-containing protein [Gaetbulibacter aquiaggeris]|uniref:DUF4357 domain-containing protein n=1 Tax=Gaetbulibacter aquiaggeris TaxID=1735373 RepID=A0ABW7ML25_9FLAO